MLVCQQAGAPPLGGGFKGDRFPVRLRLPTFGPAHMVLVVALLLIGLFLYAMVQTAAQSYRLRATERDLFLEVQSLREQRAELEGLLAYLNSDEYVEAFARQQFGLVKPGETLVEVDAPPGATQGVQPGQRWWEALFGAGVREGSPTP
ncbi:MAG: hypothetical protein AMXMBFR23_11380 [Chloroflexota bacterium]